MCQLLTEKSKAGKDEVSSFQAFCISTASRVGVGNLAGVVAAVSVGGPGSVFWMWVVALLNSSTAFIESTIAILYREKDPKGGYRGGAPYFLTKGLNQRWLGILFVIFALICWGGVFQVISNSVTESFNTAFGINTSMTSLILVILSAGVLFGNRNKIVKVLFKNEKGKHGISSLETFFLGTACRVGAGNIAGVVAAISVGGAGSIFWMWLVAMLGSATAFIESSLAVIYRKKEKDGSYTGGTPFIIEKRLNMSCLLYTSPSPRDA